MIQQFFFTFTLRRKSIGPFADFSSKMAVFEGSENYLEDENFIKLSSITGSVNILAKAESGYLVNVSIFVLNILPPTSKETSCSFFGEDMYNGEKLSFSGIAFAFRLGSGLS